MSCWLEALTALSDITAITAGVLLARLLMP